MSTQAAAGRLIGYARVSTTDQNPQLQIDALRAAGVEPRRIYTDKASGKLAHWPQLDKAMAALRKGDTLVVWKLDRLGRSLKHLVNTLEALREHGVEFRSLTQGIDTTTATGKAFYGMLAVFAAFERDLIVERTRAGLAVAHAKAEAGEPGHRPGRPRAMSPEQARQAAKMLADGDSVATISRVLGVSRPTVYRYLEAARERERVPS